jgi:hypothetical protein
VAVDRGAGGKSSTFGVKRSRGPGGRSGGEKIEDFERLAEVAKDGSGDVSKTAHPPGGCTLLACGIRDVWRSPKT